MPLLVLISFDLAGLSLNLSSFNGILNLIVGAEDFLDCFKDCHSEEGGFVPTVRVGVGLDTSLAKFKISLV